MANPNNTEPPAPIEQPLKPFKPETHNERDIATKIGSTVTKVKEEYQRTASQNGRGREDIVAARIEKRRAVAVNIFREFGMLDASGEVAFSTLYSDAEKRIQNGDIPRSDLIETVVGYEHHPVIRTATSLALVVGDRLAKEDAIAVQRAAALLLVTVEPEGIWGETER